MKTILNRYAKAVLLSIALACAAISSEALTFTAKEEALCKPEGGCMAVSRAAFKQIMSQAYEAGKASACANPGASS